MIRFVIQELRGHAGSGGGDSSSSGGSGGIGILSSLLHRSGHGDASEIGLSDFAQMAAGDALEDRNSMKSIPTTSIEGEKEGEGEKEKKEGKEGKDGIDGIYIDGIDEGTMGQRKLLRWLEDLRTGEDANKKNRGPHMKGSTSSTGTGPNTGTGASVRVLPVFVFSDVLARAGAGAVISGEGEGEENVSSSSSSSSASARLRPLLPLFENGAAVITGEIGVRNTAQGSRGISTVLAVHSSSSARTRTAYGTSFSGPDSGPDSVRPKNYFNDINAVVAAGVAEALTGLKAPYVQGHLSRGRGGQRDAKTKGVVDLTWTHGDHPFPCGSFGGGRSDNNINTDSTDSSDSSDSSENSDSTDSLLSWTARRSNLMAQAHALLHSSANWVKTSQTQIHHVLLALKMLHNTEMEGAAAWHGESDAGLKGGKGGMRGIRLEMDNEKTQRMLIQVGKDGGGKFGGGS